MEGVDIVNIIQNYDYTWGIYGPAIILAILGAFLILVGCIYFSEDGGMSIGFYFNGICPTYHWCLWMFYRQ